MKTNATTNYVFTGKLTAEGPLSTSLPALKPAKKGATTPPTPIPRIGNRMYMPGAAIKGLLRQHGSMTMVEAYKQHAGGAIDLMSYYINTKGGVKDASSEGLVPLELVQTLRHQNPVVSLHGASTPWITGKLLVTDAIVDDDRLEALQVSGVRKDDLRNPIHRAAMVEFLDASALEEWSEMVTEGRETSLAKKELAANQKKLKSLDPESKEAQDLTAEIESQKNATEGAVSVLLPLPGYEAIPPGAELEQKIVLRQGTLVELGMLLLSLNRWAKESPILGAHAATGGGQFSAEWTVSDGTNPVGTVTFTPWAGIDVKGTALNEALAAAKDFLAGEVFNPVLPEALRLIIDPPKKEAKEPKTPKAPKSATKKAKNAA